MENQKITFEKELTFNGVTYQREAVFGRPRRGETLIDNDGEIKTAEFDYIGIRVILTPKKEVYTVIKIKGDFTPDRVVGCFDNHRDCLVDLTSYAVQTVEE